MKGIKFPSENNLQFRSVTEARKRSCSGTARHICRTGYFRDQHRIPAGRNPETEMGGGGLRSRHGSNAGAKNSADDRPAVERRSGARGARLFMVSAKGSMFSTTRRRVVSGKTCGLVSRRPAATRDSMTLPGIPSGLRSRRGSRGWRRSCNGERTAGAFDHQRDDAIRSLRTAMQKLARFAF